MKSKIIVILCLMAIISQRKINAQTHGTSPNWTTPTPIPKFNILGSATKGGTGQNILQLGSGELIQCYLEQFPYPSGPKKVYFSKSLDDGNTWGVPNNYLPTTKTPFALGPTIAKDSKDLLSLKFRLLDK
jgi:hypothetical protein